MTHSQAFTEFPHQVLKCGDSVLTCGICHSSDGFKVWGFGFKVWGFTVVKRCYPLQFRQSDRAE